MIVEAVVAGGTNSSKFARNQHDRVGVMHDGSPSIDNRQDWVHTGDVGKLGSCEAIRRTLHHFVLWVRGPWIPKQTPKDGEEMTPELVRDLLGMNI